MKKIRYVLIAASFAMLAGCATTAGTTGSQATPAESSDDGAFRQRAEFKDLSVEMQEVILYGG
ncbi:MAG TPA: hypothetical protein VN642_14305 [Dongiaceae bacterium]|nr:hypothetical protein [Dongiaceae bacterium]